MKPGAALVPAVDRRLASSFRLIQGGPTAYRAASEEANSKPNREVTEARLRPPRPDMALLRGCREVSAWCMGPLGMSGRGGMATAQLMLFNPGPLCGSVGGRDVRKPMPAAHEFDQRDEARDGSVVEGGTETEDGVLKDQLYHGAKPRPTLIDVDKPPLTVNVRWICNCAHWDLHRPQHTCEGDMDHHGSNKSKGRKAGKKRSSNSECDLFEVCITHLWCLLLSRAQFGRQNVPCLAVRLQELQADEENCPQCDPQTNVGNRVDFQELREQIQHSDSPGAKFVSPSTATATGE
eukprot:CAMPEP_0206579134 /NCGR_PEP_ID=MMETSP0325_2-20121206/32372_1 /ASSEMBLY_ACC=CAM_ASM_000347 /TAXON_ID=2866 /ORGANISM="Crypthecodinium cohnii, Strain Seligo" /LENGTH=292 /DNA_ID=CAMNT_0054084895 /DNA_START=217 /DNA_END=1098 /DNA_ORIENTATION=-